MDAMEPVVAGVIAGFVTCQVALFATSIYLHRTLAHRSVKMKPQAAIAARTAIWLLTGIKPRQWVAVHRKHHAYTDVAGDPHSPEVSGFTRVLLGNALLYRSVARDKAVVSRYAQDLQPDRLDRWVFDRGLLGLAVSGAVAVALLGWEAAVVAGGVSIGGYLLAGGAINAIGHRFGTRPYPNTATNSRLLGILVAGEGLHNNHHGAPTSARFSHRRGELDPSWWAIRIMLRTRMAAVRHQGIRLRGSTRPVAAPS